uniref:Uncharacterized protein n=1 Tax=Ascaris lumbricoides TaxID=6252 RepID=A0A0M3HVC2_ASCLU
MASAPRTLSGLPFSPKCRFFSRTISRLLSSSTAKYYIRSVPGPLSPSNIFYHDPLRIPHAAIMLFTRIFSSTFCCSNALLVLQFSVPPLLDILLLHGFDFQL